MAALLHRLEYVIQPSPARQEWTRGRNLLSPSLVSSPLALAIFSRFTSADVCHFHPRGSEHRLKTQATLAYDAAGIHVFFHVADRFVISRHTAYQSSVCKDSCVEFFVQPKGDKGYFNFEVNCGGCLLLGYIEDPTRTPDGFKKFVRVPWEEAQAIRIAHSMPAVVVPEREDPTEWTIQYYVLFALLERYAGPLGKVAGQTWRGNFYKCADESSHPHWAAWAPIGEDLNFHQPRYFGQLRFSE